MSSPRLNLTTLPSALRPSSPSPTAAPSSSATFTFPPPAPPLGAFTATGGPAYVPRPPLSTGASSSSSLSPSVGATPSSSTTARFHQALAAFPSRTTNGHTKQPDSVSSLDGFRDHLPDSASPTSQTTFDSLQSALGGPGPVGLGFADHGPSSSSWGRRANGGYGSAAHGMPDDARFSDEPESFETVRRRPNAPPREEVTFEDALLAAGASLHGRPASMDMGVTPSSSGAGDEDRPFGFLLSPPPVVGDFSASRPLLSDLNGPPRPFLPTEPTRPFPPAPLSSSSTNGANIFPKPKPERGRTFPAPLLLKGDRPFGGSNSSSPVLGSGAFSSPSAGTVQPLFSLPRKSSVSAAGPLTTASNGPPPSTRPPWTPSASTSSLPFSSSSTASGRPQPTPYQRGHRPHQSSQSHSTSSIPYHHSHSQSTSTSTSSTVVLPNGSEGGATVSSATSALSFATASSSTAGASFSGGGSGSEPLAPQALLLLILSMRSATSSFQPMVAGHSHGGGSSRAGTPLFSQSAQSSISAPPAQHQRARSGGSATSDTEESPPRAPTAAAATGRLDTVDLSHKRIAEVPVEVIEELRDEVEKLALGYNLLRELPRQFAGLSRLRYLNVRVNLLTSFPQVLCEMPSLEILDISRNKIRRLPTQPGTLLNLKVFSIAKNRVKRLPTYIVQMAHLKVFKVDHNPLEWPPKEVTYFPVVGDNRPPNKAEEAEEMQRWLPNLVRWMRENGERRDRVRTSLPPPDHPSDDERHEERSYDSSRTMTRVDSNRPVTVSPPSSRPRTAESRIGAEDESLRVHGRNASHSTAQSLEPEVRPTLRSKKSLPDLRQPHADILAERRTGSPSEDPRTRPPVAAASALRRLRLDKHPGIQHTSSARAVLTTQTLASSSPASLANAAPTLPPPQPLPLRPSSPIPKTTLRRPLTPNNAVRGDFEQSSLKRNERDRTTNGGFDRSSGAYFRRLSMLPASTISKAVPVTLLEFADAIRGILFSLSQIYTALRQFVVFASQDRLPAPLARLMGSSDGSMSLLINALDRFDSLSRRGTPEASIVRDIFVTCRDNVSTFLKLVSALQPELKSLVATADVRYTRTLLLMLYGSTGEIAKSWNAVSPMLADMSLLHEDPTLATLILQPPAPSAAAPGNLLASRGGPTGLYRARSKTRRHAGSFSVEDVQLGAVLPPAAVPVLSAPASSYPDAPGLYAHSSTSEDDPHGSASTVRARPAKTMHAPAPGSITLPPMLGPRDMIVNAFEQPLTPGGAGLFFGDQNGDSEHPHPMPMPIRSGSFSVAPAPPRPEPTRSATVTPTTTVSADETFLDMVDSTTGIAFDVYGTLLDSFDEAAEGRDGEGAAALMRDLGPRRTKELTDLCILGNEVTTKLTGSLGRVRGHDPYRRPLKFSAADAKRLGDDAYTFVQTVIRFAKLVKAISLEHGFAPRVREGVGQLTISTREFAKALSNSATSFRPNPPGSSANPAFPSRPIADAGVRQA